MKQLKTMASLVVILGVIMMGTLNANAGIIVTGLAEKTDPNPCTQTKVDSGIIVTGKVDNGIIVTGLAVIFGRGVIDAFFGKAEVPTDCGIIVVG